MTEVRDEQSPLSPDDAAFVDRLTEAYAPRPLESTRRAALDAALAERAARRRPLWLGAPLLAGAAFAALALWLLAPPGIGPAAPESAVTAAVAPRVPGIAAWEDELLDALTIGEIEETDEIDELPDDYAAIAAFFLDG